MRVRTWAIALFVTVASVVGGCRGDVDPASALTTGLQQIVAGEPVLPVQAPVWADVRTFYERRENRPAWVSEEKTARAAEGLQMLRTAREHGLVAADYGEAQIAQQIDVLDQSKSKSSKEAPDRLQQLAALDAHLTTALLALGRDVAVGRASSDRRWKARRELPDLVGTLTEAAGGDVKSWLSTIRPKHPEYAALQQALINLEAQRDKGAWAKVAAGTFAPGKTNPSMNSLRQRLAAAGHLEGAAVSNTSPAYSSDDQAGVKSFQALHALPATGIVDAATLAAMNVPIDHRIRQVQLNLERWRWMPDDLGARHLLVNIPYFHLVARENGEAVKDIRVVVGTPENKTPVFSSKMTTVVFSPYWNIPDSIVEGETAPAIARDPAYLAKNNIEILDVSKSGAAPVDYSSVDWDDADQLKHLAFRQRPGPGNALGHVKFLFPNDYDVYLHDTPADKLFARPGRAFSHGCVRVEEPEALAKYILGGYPEWDDASILEAMHSGVEKHVKLKEAIPVHIVYFTAWVDDNGGLHFQPDVYGYDT
jgi:L,D-transpeptidase YcbB